jgi:hypothetical protein
MAAFPHLLLCLAAEICEVAIVDVFLKDIIIV